MQLLLVILIWQLVNFIKISKLIVCYQDTQSCVSGQGRRVAHKCVIYSYRQVTIFNTSYLYNHWNDFYQIYIFYALHIRDFTLYIPNLKKIGLVVSEIYTFENCPIFFTFSSSYRFNTIPFSQKNNLLLYRFPSNLVH